MAIKNCEGCGCIISTKGKTCPQCGSSIANMNKIELPRFLIGAALTLFLYLELGTNAFLELLILVVSMLFILFSFKKKEKFRIITFLVAIIVSGNIFLTSFELLKSTPTTEYAEQEVEVDERKTLGNDDKFKSAIIQENNRIKLNDELFLCLVKHSYYYGSKKDCLRKEDARGTYRVGMYGITFNEFDNKKINEKVDYFFSHEIQEVPDFESFYIVQRLPIGEYNFNRKSFPVQLTTTMDALIGKFGQTKAYISQNGNISATSLNIDFGYQNQCNINIPLTTLYNPEIRLDETSAEQLLSNNDGVFRSVNAKIYFNLDVSDLNAHMVKVEFFSDENVFIGTFKYELPG